MNLEIRLMEIEAEIKKAKSDKNTAIVLMVISIFFLWPLLIIGGIWYSSADNKLKSLEAEKNQLIMYQSMNEKNEQCDISTIRKT